MNYKLLSLHIACGLLLATGVAFGMELEQPNPEQQHLNIVFFDGNKYDTYNHNLNQILTNENITLMNGNCTFKYTDTEQTINWLQRLPLDKKLSPEQIKAITDELSLTNKNPQAVYIEQDNQLFRISKIEHSPLKRQRSTSESSIMRTNSSALLRTTKSNPKMQPEKTSILDQVNPINSVHLEGQNALFTRANNIQNDQNADNQGNLNVIVDPSPAQTEKENAEYRKMQKDAPYNNNAKISSKMYGAFALGLSIAAVIAAYLKFPEKFAPLLESLKNFSPSQYMPNIDFNAQREAFSRTIYGSVA